MSDSDDDAAFASADEGEPTLESASGNQKGKDSVVKKGKKEGADNKESTEQKSTESKQKETGKGRNKKSTENVQKSTESKQKETGKGRHKKGKKNTGSTSEKSVISGDTQEKECLDSDKPVTEIAEDRLKDMSITDDVKVSVKSDDKEQESASLELEKNSKGQGEPGRSEMTERKTVASSQETKDHSSAKTDTPQEKTDPKLEKLSQTSQEKTDPKLALEKLSQTSQEKSGGSWGWGSWGSSLVGVASTSVSTFGNQLGEGFTTIMDTVETALGAPPMEELIKPKDEDDPPDTETIERDSDQVVDVKEPESTPEASSSREGSKGWFSSWGMSNLTSVVQSTTSIVQHTGQNLVTGGLDVLETIGKKTFDVIKDHESGLLKTKEFLFDRGDKPNLSKLLREAKEEEAMKVEMVKHQEEARLANFSAMFDEYQGLAHLEALEILSNQCEKKVQSLLGSVPEEKVSAIKPELIKIKQVFERMEEENDDEEEKEHEFAKLITEHLSELHLGTTPDKLNKTQEKIRQSIANLFVTEDDIKIKAVHQEAIQSLAEMTAKSVEQFHKAGELIVLQKDTNKSFVSRAQHLESLTRVLCTEVGIISTKFCQCLNKLADGEENSEINPAVTNIYLEASNSSVYIQDALQLLLPCLQQAAVQRSLT